MKNPRFVCFYSYKGGTGRSLTLANIAYLLAAEGNKVLIMDMDMEAPGQHMTDLFHEEYPIPKPGLLELLLDRKRCLDQNKPFFFDSNQYIRRSTAFDRDISEYNDYDSEQSIIRGNGCIDLLPVSQSVDLEFQSKLAEWDWELFYSKYSGEDFLQYLKLAFSREDYDFVLIDSRTGMSDVFFVSTLSLADTVVLVSSLNRQNIEGAALAANTLNKEKLIAKYGVKKIFFIFSPMPQGISTTELDKRIKEIKYDWKELKQIAAHIPYQPELSLSEKILIRESIIKKYAFESEYCSEIKKLHSILIDKDSVSSIDPLNERESNILSLQDPKSINPFPENRVEYLKAEQVVHYFVDPGGIIHYAMRQFMPTVLYGSRGTGKTILARWLSFEILAYRLKETGLSLQPSNVTTPIGLWFRLDIDLLNVFNTRDSNLKEKFSRLFGQFFDLLILRKALDALTTLGGIDAWCNDSELYKILTREMGRTSPLKTYQDMADCIEQCLADIRAFINNPERAPLPYLIQDNVMMKLLVKELVKNGGLANDCYFIAFIDEYENFNEDQQRIVNTRLKQVKESDRITYKLLARNGGIHTHETLANSQPIEVTHDFRSYNLDEGVEFNDFKTHIGKIIEKRLNDSRFFTDRGYVTADSLFTNLSAEDEAFTIGDKKGNQPLIAWLKKHYKQMDIVPLIEWMSQEENLLRRVVAVVLLNQGKKIDQIIEEFNNNSQISKDWYHNYHRGALFWMCRLYDKTKRYAGFGQIVGIAGNNTRVALDLCNAIVDAWLAGDESRTLPITVAIQDAAIHGQSETYFRLLRERRNGDEYYHRFVERLGRLFELIHKGPRQGEPEINHFIIEGELDEKTEKSLKHCRNEAILRWLPGNKQKGKADQQKDAWQLHPRYTPYFNISWRRKKMLKLRAAELSVLFSGDEKQWKQVVKRIDEQYCKLTSDTSNQQSWLDENND